MFSLDRRPPMRGTMIVRRSGSSRIASVVNRTARVTPCGFEPGETHPAAFMGAGLAGVPVVHRPRDRPSPTSRPLFELSADHGATPPLARFHALRDDPRSHPSDPWDGSAPPASRSAFTCARPQLKALRRAPKCERINRLRSDQWAIRPRTSPRTPATPTAPAHPVGPRDTRRRHRRTGRTTPTPTPPRRGGSRNPSPHDIPRISRSWPGASLRRRMDSPSPPGELTVVSAGGREGHGSASPAPASGPVGCLVIGSRTSLLPFCFAWTAPETSGIYTVTHSVCPHAVITLLTPAWMRRVLDF